MSLSKTLAAGLLAALSFPALALLEDQNHFQTVHSGTACVLAVDPRREALDILFSAPDTLVLQTNYEFIPGSAIKLSFDDGSSLQLASLPSSTRRQASAHLSAEQLALFSHNAHVKIGGDSIRGPLFRKIGLGEFAAAYAEFGSCAH